MKAMHVDQSPARRIPTVECEKSQILIHYTRSPVTTDSDELRIKNYARLVRDAE